MNRMDKQTRRGYAEGDEREFGREAFLKLSRGGEDICFLLNRGYPLEGASTFVCNHYMLSKRQRVALIRWAASEEALSLRKGKERKGSLQGRTLHIDGFNTIITLEVALSAAPVIKCLDGTFRDLAGLRGTYHPIDKTITALNLMGDYLERKEIRKAVFYLDAPVSNSGRLSGLIRDIMQKYRFETEALCVNGVDRLLKDRDYAVTSDSVIMEQGRGWLNLTPSVLPEKSPELWIIDFSGRDTGKMNEQGGAIG